MGIVTLINGSPYDWKLTIDPMIVNQPHDGPVVSSGASYQFDNVPKVFEFTLWDGSKVSIYIEIKNISIHFQNIDFRPPQSTSDISVPFVSNLDQFELFISGQGKPYFGNTPPTDWMHQILSIMQPEATLKEFCLPSSHESGMYKIWAQTNCPGVSEANTVTQSLTFLEQLQCGVRFFDLRPGGWRSGFYALHCSYVNQYLGWKGACGDEFGAIFSQLNTFTTSNAELIIIEMAAGQAFRWPQNPLLEPNCQNLDHLYQEQWNQIFEKIQKEVKHLFNCDPATDTTSDLTTLPVSRFIGSGQAAVVFLVSNAASNNINLGSYEGKGIFYGNAAPGNAKWTLSYIASPYSDGTDNSNPDSVEQRVFRQISSHKHDYNNNTMIEVSYVLAQTSTQAVFSPAGTGSSVKGLAKSIRPKLYKSLINKCTGEYFPNLISLDNVDRSLGSIAVAITLRKGRRPSKLDLGLGGPILVTRIPNKQEYTPSLIGFILPPRIASGLQSFDLTQSDVNYEICAATSVSKATSTSFLVRMPDVRGTYTTALGVNCLLCGSASGIYVYGGENKLRPEYATTKYATSFTSPPRIICWIKGFSIGHDRTKFNDVQLRAYPSQIGPEVFLNVVESRTGLLLWGYSDAIVIPPDFPNVACGTFAVHDMRDRTSPSSSVFGQVKFVPALPDGSEPRIATGLSQMDFSAKASLRLRAPAITNLTPTGFNWTIETWDDTIMYDVEFSYIAWV